jgi:hypothetical protein
MPNSGLVIVLVSCVSSVIAIKINSCLVNGGPRPRWCSVLYWTKSGTQAVPAELIEQIDLLDTGEVLIISNG